MKTALLLVALAACGHTGPCEVDSDCDDGDKCARTMECLPSSQVWAVRAEWTVNGQTPTMTSCLDFPSLEIRFFGDSIEDSVGFAPVPCASGVFTIDKVPSHFLQAELGPEGGAQRRSNVDQEGHVRFDL